MKLGGNGSLMESFPIDFGSVIKLLSSSRITTSQPGAGFVVLYPDSNPCPIELEKVLVKKIRAEIGPIACLKQVMVLPTLPKTRSGKVLRNVLKGMVRGAKYKVPPTISDATVLPVINQIILAKGLGKKSDLEFGDE